MEIITGAATLSLMTVKSMIDKHLRLCMSRLKLLVKFISKFLMDNSCSNDCQGSGSVTFRQSLAGIFPVGLAGVSCAKLTQHHPSVELKVI